MDEKTETIDEETIQQRTKEAVTVFAKEAVAIFLEGWEDTPEAGLPCFWLGESIRVDLVEGGSVILPVCLPCVPRARAHAEGDIKREAA